MRMGLNHGHAMAIFEHCHSPPMLAVSVLQLNMSDRYCAATYEPFQSINVSQVQGSIVLLFNKKGLSNPRGDKGIG
jgi:hypothetical protein